MMQADSLPNTTTDSSLCPNVSPSVCDSQHYHPLVADITDVSPELTESSDVEHELSSLINQLSDLRAS